MYKSLLFLLFLPLAWAGNAQELGDYVYLLGQKQQNGNYLVPYGMGNLVPSKPASIKAFPIYESGGEDPSTSIGEGTIAVLGAKSCEVKIGSEAESLLFEFPNPQKKAPYTSIHLLLAAQGVSIGDEEKEAFHGLEEAYAFTEYHEYALLEKMRAHVAYVAGAMRGSMNNMEIKGDFDGQKLFDAMEASTIKNIHQFLTYVYIKPERYRGQTWMLAEIYATWMTSETPLPEFTGNYFGGNLGIHLADGEMGYPHVSELLTRIYTDEELFTLGDLIISVGGNSMYGKSANEVLKALEGDEGTVCDLKVLRQNGAFASYEIPRMRINDRTPSNWNKLEKKPEEIALLPVTRGEKWGIIDRKGKEAVNLVYDKIQDFSNGLAPFKKNGLWGFMNYEGTEVIAPKWKKVYSFSEGIAAVFKTADDLTFGGTPEFIDRKGNVVINAQYETNMMCYIFSEGRYTVQIGGKSACIDAKGQLVVPPKFYSINTFENGMAWAIQEEKGLYGLIDKQGNWLLAPAYTNVNPFENGQALVRKDGISMIINTEGKVIKKFDLEILSAGMLMGTPAFSEGRARIRQQELLGFADDQGKVVIPARYKDTSWRFSEGMIGVSEDKLSWYFIDKNGKKPFEHTYEAVSYFSEGLCWVKKNGKWGLIDQKGQALIPPSVSTLPGFFKNGSSLVNVGDFLNEKYALVDKEGNILWQ